MDADQIRQLKPMLTHYLRQFDDCFARKDTRGHLSTYVEGQLSELPRKSVEPIAVAADKPVRTLQEFLSQHRWEEDRLRRRLHELVVTDHAGQHSIGVIDETSDVKKGDKTPGVQRQWCGTVGKQENCIVTVHLGYAVDDFHCLVDGELYLPESWVEDRERCREAGIPDEVGYRPKWGIALELYDRARGHGIEFEWLTFDEGYGSKTPFLRALDERKQRFIAEVPRNLGGWIEPPKVAMRPYRKSGGGRPRRTPRLTKGSPPAQRIDQLVAEHPKFTRQRWKKYRVKDGQKGPLVWEVKHATLIRRGDDGLPAETYRLLVARNVLDPNEVKFFLTNAPESMSVGTLLLVAFSRWRVERCFQDQKQEIGLDAWEGRRWIGLKRHLIISAVSYLFLARVRERLRGKKPGVDGLPSARRRRRAGRKLVA
jgi:SRSO17 transposase